MTYPYAKVADNLRKYLRKIRRLRIPERVSNRYLYSIGFKSSYDRSFPKILQFLGLLDENRGPTELYRRFRQKEGPKIMAKALKEAFVDLFEEIPEPCKADEATLYRFFKDNTRARKATAEDMASTFKTLCEFADLDRGEDDMAKKKSGKKKSTKKLETEIPNLTINLEIELPEVEEEGDLEIYDKIFESLRKNLLDHLAKK